MNLDKMVKLMKATLIVTILIFVAFLVYLFVFVSSASAAGFGEVTLTVKQVYTNTASSAPPSKTLSYKLIPKPAGGPMPEGSGTDGYTFAITGTNDMDIGPVTFTHAGVYAYEISNTTTPASGYTYDREIYTVEVYVKSDMTVNIVVYKRDGGKAADISYTHSYNLQPSDPNLMTDPPVVKTVSGRPATSSTFTFHLTAVDPKNPMPAGSANGVKKIYITGSGWAEFGTWSYTEEGTYYYKVAEVNSNIRGYTYDTAVYTITDSVKATDGQLVLARVVTNSSNRQVASFSFINTYTSSGGGGGGIIIVPPTPPPVKPTPEPEPTPTPEDPGKEIPEPDIPEGGPEPDEVPEPEATPEPDESGNLYEPGSPDNPSNPGRNPGSGPKTGDGSQTTLHIIIICLAGITALGSGVYLLTGKRRRRCK